MTNTKIIEKLKYLEKFNISKNQKVEFIKKLYKLANISFSEYLKNGQTDTNK